MKLSDRYRLQCQIHAALTCFGAFCVIVGSIETLLVPWQFFPFGVAAVVASFWFTRRMRQWTELYKVKTILNLSLERVRDAELISRTTGPVPPRYRRPH